MLTHGFKSNNVFSEKLPNMNMDSNRHCSRRVMPHKEAEFSSQSIMKAMEKFVQAVQEMDETILVPSRLMDLEVGEDSDGFKAPASTASAGTGKRDGSLSSTDLYRLYNMVNTVKNELLWGSEEPAEEHTPAVSRTTTGSAGSTTSLVKTHVRRPSTVSVASTTSGSNLSDTDSETGAENDSGVEGECPDSVSPPPYTQRMEDNFRRHLAGLHRSLSHMTEAATYLTRRYQSDIGGPV